MKKSSFLGGIILGVVSLLSIGAISGAALSENQYVARADAATTALVKVDGASATGEQIASGSGHWRAGTNATVTSVTSGGKKYARIARTTTGSTVDSKTARLVFSGTSYTLWHKCTITYTLSTSITESYMVAFANLADKKLTTGTLQTVTFDYTGGYPKELVDNETYFKFYCSNINAVLDINNWEFYVEATEGTVSITKGTTGVNSVFVSSDASATSGSTSETFDIGTKVYGFAKTKAGYVMPSGWTLVSGTAGAENALYRNAGYTLDTTSYSFGTINANEKQYQVTWDTAGGSATGLPTSYTITSGFTTSIEPLKRGYTFLGWTGSNGSTPQKTITVPAGSTGDKSYTANWEIINYSISYDLKGGTVSTSNPTTYTVLTPAFTLNNPSRTGCDFTGWTGSGLSEKTVSVTLNPTNNDFPLGDKEYTATYEYDSEIQQVVDLILGIGGPTNVSYPGSLTALNEAQSAYNSLIELHPEYAGIIVEYDELVSDWETYNNLRATAINNAKNLINAIGTVTYPGSGDAINAARLAYNALHDGDKSEVNNYSTLVAAEARYQVLKEAKEVADQVNELIDAIGEVTYPDSKAAIETARAAYEALTTDDQRSFVNLVTLENAESTYASLRNAAISNVEDLIDAIGVVTYPGSKEAIGTAREAYNTLPDEDKPEVSNYQTLLNAESTYESLRSAAISNVEGLIDDIGTVVYPDSKDDIEVAREAYEALAENDKSEVSNYSTLVAAEARYQELKEAKEVADQVNELIDAIGEVTYPDSKAAIETARAAYEALTTDDQRSFVNLVTLENAESTYASLRNAAISNVENLIDDIGTVIYPDSGPAINAARTAYNALPNYDQPEVSNYQTLLAAEAAYKEAKDQADAAIVRTLIANIGEVKYPISYNPIKIARDSYEALSTDAKAYVDNLSVLEAAEAEYEALRNAAINNVEELINAIGEVKYPTSGQAITSARTAYNALPNVDKSEISNYRTLIEAEATYARLKADHDAAEAVITLIDAIGDVEFSDTCKAKIDAAKDAYDALTVAQKELVTNKKTLFDAIELYNILAHQPEVNDNGVQIEGKDGDLIPVNVNVKVEVKTDVQAKEGSVEYEKIQEMLGSQEKISGVYDVKLIRTIDGVEEEIQPSDIKDGMVIIVEITLPDGLNIEGLKILHIHSEDDISYIENFSIDGDKVVFETDRLSEFAFVTLKPNNVLPAWAIALIIIGGLLVLACLLILVIYVFNPVYYVDHYKKEVRKAIKIKNHGNEVIMINSKLQKVRRNEVDVYRSKEEAELASGKTAANS